MALIFISLVTSKKNKKQKNDSLINLRAMHALPREGPQVPYQWVLAGVVSGYFTPTANTCVSQHVEVSTWEEKW